MPHFPQTKAGWLLTIIGIVLLLIAIGFHWTLLQVFSGYRPLSFDNRELVLAIYYGVPALLLSALVSGLVLAKTDWRSHLALFAMWFAMASLISWTIGLFSS